jgi:tRNA U34 5-methylaminomethyl-2-thiouridine-forming methyltransferase MnmC
MKRHIETTADGSSTLVIEEWGEPYHSRHGAIREAYHVFIEMGLRHCALPSVSILEMGFGTGLNALITLKEATALKKSISYTGIEAYPVTMNEVAALNYIEQLSAGQYHEAFHAMHSGPWETPLAISDTFSLIKKKCDFKEVKDAYCYDLVYFDAFGANVQPGLWTEVIFGNMFAALRDGGVLVTYAAKGSVRRAMQAVGFLVERLPGPPGKREMLRAVKKHR